MEQDNMNFGTFTCPECDDVLQEVGHRLYQCSLGHVYSLPELILEQQQKNEKLLWKLHRGMTQRIEMLSLMVVEDIESTCWIMQQTAESTAATTVFDLLQQYK